MSASDLDSSSLSSPSQGREFVVSGEALWQWWQLARREAIAAHISPTEVDWFLQELSGLSPLEFRLGSFRDYPQIILQHSLKDLAQLWQQRIQARMPVQYLTGTAPWREFSLTVSPAVLIPRPETELLIDLAVMAVREGGRNQESGDGRKIPAAWGEGADRGDGSDSHWADLGTGSGAIALGLARAFPAAQIHGVDQSAAALAIAQTNAQTYHLDHQIHFYQGVWFEPLAHLQGRLRGMVSNPPYIPSAMVPDLQPEVSRHEPHLALDGGADGLDCIRHLVATAPEYLQPGGIWLVEMMAGQAEQVSDLLQRNGHYRDIQIHRDLAGIERFALVYRR